MQRGGEEARRGGGTKEMMNERLEEDGERGAPAARLFQLPAAGPCRAREAGSASSATGVQIVLPHH
jgi:hypothetical protein